MPIDVNNLGKIYVKSVSTSEIQIKTPTGVITLSGENVPVDGQYLIYNDNTKELTRINPPIAATFGTTDGNILVKDGDSFDNKVRFSGVISSNLVTDTNVHIPSSGVAASTVPILFDISNKKVVRLPKNDRLPATSMAELNTGAGVAWDMDMVTSGIILRTSNGSDVTDTLPTAAQFVSYFDSPYVGMTIALTVSKDKGSLRISGGNGINAIGVVKIDNDTLRVEAGNQVEIKFIIRNVLSGTENVSMIITSKIF